MGNYEKWITRAEIDKYSKSKKGHNSLSEEMWTWSVTHDYKAIYKISGQ